MKPEHPKDSARYDAQLLIELAEDEDSYTFTKEQLHKLLEIAWDDGSWTHQGRKNKADFLNELIK